MRGVFVALFSVRGFRSFSERFPRYSCYPHSRGSKSGSLRRRAISGQPSSRRASADSARRPPSLASRSTAVSGGRTAVSLHEAMRTVAPPDLAVLALAVGIAPELGLRVFSPRDLPALESICADVYDGGDYLPKMALQMSSDVANTLLVLTDADLPIAVASLKRLSASTAWLEAVRTAPERRGSGHATCICAAQVCLAASEGRRLLSATVASNTAMLRTFARCGLAPAGSIHLLSWPAVRALPGWASGNDQGCAPPRSLLRALDLESTHVTPAARSLAARFERLGSAAAVRRALAATGGGVGGSGCLPGLYKLLSDDAVAAAATAEPGRGGGVWWLERPACVMALWRDEAISSLRSQWVCCIYAAAPSGADGDSDDADVIDVVAAAVWRASEEHGHRPFCLAVDGALPVEGLLAALPLNQDPCVLYGGPEPGAQGVS